MKDLYPPLIPYIWIMLDNLKAKGLIGSPRFMRSTYTKKNQK
jgi:hypothetical protein